VIQLICFKNCTVKNKEGDLLFKPEWGTYDMAVGKNIRAVFAGTADKENYNTLPPKSEEIAIEINYSDDKKHLFTLYQQVRDMRKTGTLDLVKLEDIEMELTIKYPEEWLLHLEIVELLKDESIKSELLNKCMDKLQELKNYSKEYANLINEGLTLINETR
jgi:phenylalanine-4-hydroxylase